MQPPCGVAHNERLTNQRNYLYNLAHCRECRWGTSNLVQEKKDPCKPTAIQNKLDLPRNTPAPAPHLSTWQCLDHQPFDPSEIWKLWSWKKVLGLEPTRIRILYENLRFLALQRVFQSMIFKLKQGGKPRFPLFTRKKQLQATVSKKNLWNNDSVTDEVTILAAGNELPLGSRSRSSG